MKYTYKHTSRFNRIEIVFLNFILKFKKFLSDGKISRFQRSLAKRDPRYYFGTSGKEASKDDLAKLRKDIQVIFDSTEFQPEFFLGEHANRCSRISAVRKYVKQFRSNINPRKPEPGFNPHVFLEQARPEVDLGVDPYAEFLRRERPEGPWQQKVIENNNSQYFESSKQHISAALHIHAFYLDQLEYIMNGILLNQSKPDIYISINKNTNLSDVKTLTSVYSDKVVNIVKVPNAGRDLGPFLTGFKHELANSYDFIGHVHTKKSLHIKNSKWSEDWFKFCIANVIGSSVSGPMIDCIIEEMLNDPLIGLVYPADPHLPGWGVNRNQAEILGNKLKCYPLPSSIDFPVGSMFWARSEVLKPFFDLGLTWSDYPSEPIPDDGTMLHALERLFGTFPMTSKWRSAVTHTRGVVR